MGNNKNSNKINQDNCIYKYYQGIRDGSICVGRWISLLYEYIVKGLEDGLFYFDQKKANDAIYFVEHHCFHTEGVKAPGELKLELWQQAFLSCVYGICDNDTHTRRFREIVLIVARKNGKSLLGASIGKYNFEKDGGFGARVYCIAPKLDQAEIIYNDIWQMIQLDPDWQEAKRAADQRDAHNKKMGDDTGIARHRQTDLQIPAMNSTVKKIAFSSRKSDGFNPTLTICDEVASWQGDAGLKQYEVLKSGMGARPEGQMLSCSTSGYISDGIYDELIKRSTRFLLGDSKEKRLLPFLYMIDDVSKWNDINELRKSNPNLGVSVSVDYLIEEISIAEQSLSKKAEFICKYCNIKQNSSQAWLPEDKVDACSGEKLQLEDFRECYGVCGIDLSRTTDLTAAVCVIERDGILNVFAQFYMPAEKVDELTARDGLPYKIYVERGLLKLSGENFVDYHDCYEWMRSLIADYHIYPLQTGYDRYCAQYLIQDLNNYGFHTDDVYQGYNLSPVIREAEGLIKDGCVNIGDNDLLKIHFLNSALQLDSGSGKCRLIKIAPTDHIDGMAAFLDALTVRQKYFDQMGYQLKNER